MRQRTAVPLPLALAPRRRLEQQFEHQEREIKGLSSSMGRLRVDLQRVNGLIAQVGAREVRQITVMCSVVLRSKV